MANPYVVVIGNVCAGKSTFVNQFSACHKDWCCFPEVLDERQRNSLRGPDAYDLYASFFTDYYIERHLLSPKLPGPLIQESCLETSSLFPEIYYKNNCLTQDKYIALELKYANYLKVLPRPDFYIYLYAPLEVLLARAENRKEPARSVSKMLLPQMQDRLEDWVETCVNPEQLCRVHTQDVNIGQMNKILDDLQAQVKRLKNRSSGENRKA